MPRPRKHRIVSSMPSSEGFAPFGYADNRTEHCPSVIMTVDEYETIRLIDFLGLTQEECAIRMQVSRPTITNIYESARRKLADALVNEKQLLIGGGNYAISSENRRTATIEEFPSSVCIAVTYDDGLVFQHFGHCEKFKIYHTENGRILSSSVKNTEGCAHGALIGFLKRTGAEILICGGIGAGAQNALSEAGIRFFGGVSGPADAAAEALLAGTLEYNASIKCDRHHREHHESGCSTASNCSGGNSL